ncbi:cell filamentation protein Fic [Duganella sp. FT135W]|uniref:Cell filamentation protein Fic n=1 Tax=Duganella flavida TaxID=2692175 RepID=A0A6L8K2V5_9BURK|nr:Fic family protein [Duganella flavida]MYM21849.1 cell filamentation protein Fic [Duganella flavida]
MELSELDQLKQRLDALRPLPREHFKPIKIHPVADGNGRTAPLLLNLALLKAGYPPIVLPVERRLEYYTALDAAHVDGELSPFINIVADCMYEAFSQYWFVLGV